MREVVVRMATLADVPLARRVRLRALAAAPDAFASTLEREVAFEDAEWERRVGPGNWVLALCEGEPVGVTACVLEPGRPADTRDLVAMWVAPEWRGCGVAERLVEVAAAWARTKGAARLALWVAADNHRAVRFYERLGFVRTGEQQPLPNRPEVLEERMLRPLALDNSVLDEGLAGNERTASDV